MPTVRRSRTISAPPSQVWEVVGDPHHLPRWWPRVTRVEAVDRDAFTEVLHGERGKAVRADFRLLHERPERSVTWAQAVEGTPFARVLKSAETEIGLSSADGGADGATEVTIVLRQALRGLPARLGAHLVRRAARATIEEALDGLERIVGRRA